MILMRTIRMRRRSANLSFIPMALYRETYYFWFEKMVNGIMESALSFEIGADGYFRRFVWWHSRFDEMIEIPDSRMNTMGMLRRKNWRKCMRSIIAREN